MSAITVQNLGQRVGQRREPSGALAHPWSAAWLAECLLNLQHEVLRRRPTSDERAVVEKIIALAQQPDVLAALRKRKDPQEAARDLVIRYAFQLMLAEGWDSAALDALSRAMIQRTLDVIYKRAAQVARKVGEDPLSAEPELLLRLCESLARHTLHQPVGAHIQWKLEHYEGAVSRAMRQIKHLVTRPEVTEAFVAFVLAADTPEAPAVLKAQLLHLARGGGLTGLDYAATIAFFAEPATVAFVKIFAKTVQTARTFYAEDEYTGIPWRGQRRLPQRRRQGYLEAALAQLARKEDESLDSEDFDLHSSVGEQGYEATEDQANLLHRETFAVWLTRRALDARPDDGLWQAGRHRYIDGRSCAEIVARGLADQATLDALQMRVDALRADPEIWHLWVQSAID